MNREAKNLFSRAVDSLVLSVEHFNRPHDRGRVEAVLILLDHSLELLLKAAILHRGGRIRKRRATTTLGFEACVNACLLEPRFKFLKPEEADTLRISNSLRDGAQHHFIIVSEEQLYLTIQSGVTLFDDILSRVFGKKLADFVPQRVLPISTMPPQDFPSLMEREIAEIKGLLVAGSRRKSEARGRLRTIALIDGAMRQDPRHPTDKELHEKLAQLASADWMSIFPGAASLRISADGTGHAISLRLTKSDGIPVRLAKEGEPTATVVAIRKVDTLSFYSYRLKSLAGAVALSPSRALSVIRFLKLQEDEECFKQLQIGKSIFKCYSPTAVARIKEALPGLDMAKVWEQAGLARHKKAV
ncbi:MAG: hypothetical protein L3K16_06150 [Thermoplasmata archaeon]|nr:hypothetical protein [Thermoplasmata archaeon]